MPDVKVEGFCPMGCGETLALGYGRVVCSKPACPDPTRAHLILANSETEHIVDVREHDFVVRHPLRERVAAEAADDEDLFECDLFKWLTSLPGAPGSPGRYRARPWRNSWTLERV